MAFRLVVGPSAFTGIGTGVIAQFSIILAAVAYGGAVTFGQTFRDLDPMMQAAGSLIWGGVILFPFSLLVDRPWTLHPAVSSIAALFAVSVFSTALAHVLYFTLVQRLGSVGTTAQAYLRVPIGVVVGALFLEETPNPNSLLVWCSWSGVLSR